MGPIPSEAVKSLSPDVFRTHGSARLAHDGDGVAIHSTDARWSFAASVAVDDIPGWRQLPPDARKVVTVTIDVQDGEAGIGLVDPSFAAFVTGEIVRVAGDRAAVLLDVPPASAPAALIVRRTDARAGGRLACVVRSIDAVSAESVDPRRLRQCVSDGFAADYRHYTFDLGHGVELTASRPGIMAAHRLNHRIVMALAERTFGSLAGLRVLDAGCSSGFHALGYAQAGADVLGIDTDGRGIAQANAVLTHAPWLEDVRRAGRCRFAVGDVTTFAPPDGRPFDLVFCLGVLYHLRNIIDAFGVFARTSQRGLVLRSYVAEGDELTLTLADSRRYCFCFEGEMAFVPTRRLIEHLCRHAGFRDVRSYRPQDLVPSNAFEGLHPVDRDAWLRQSVYVVASK